MRNCRIGNGLTAARQCAHHKCQTPIYARALAPKPICCVNLKRYIFPALPLWLRSKTTYVAKNVVITNACSLLYCTTE